MDTYLYKSYTVYVRWRRSLFIEAPHARSGEKGENNMAEENNEKRKEQQRKASEKYLKEKVEDIRIRVPKGDKAKYKQAADDFELSLNQFVIDAMNEKIERGKGGTTE